MEPPCVGVLSSSFKLLVAGGSLFGLFFKRKKSVSPKFTQRSGKRRGFVRHISMGPRKPLYWLPGTSLEVRVCRVGVRCVRELEI
jgi:hypothetical protein